ncbi:MAG: phage terminase large subunit family protein [Candidatus Contendobacter sp.]|jgi:phage terminase large subunit GpA-like protein|nr:phage terminase large subunit family protein [Candidatus Contendobacter sp.]
MADGRRAHAGAAKLGLAPPPRLGVHSWADQHRRLPTKGSGEPGPWRTARTPYTREIMECLSPDHPARRVVFIKSAQVGATEIILNWIGWFIATQRAPMMVVQPTIDVAERFSKQRLAGMIDDSPQLRELIPPARSRDSGNTTLLKEYPGGVVVLSGANSAASLRSLPIRYLALDEVDAYPYDLDGEGDPISLAEARSTTFPRRKIFLVSTPTIESLSRIHKEWLASDQRRYHVPCPHCGDYQPLQWDHLTWPVGEPQAAVYACPSCGAVIPEHHKTTMLAAGQWRAARPESPVPGFHLNALYAPLGLGLSWAELAAEWDGCQRDPNRQKVFVNTRLGECYADPDEKLDWEEIKARAGGYAVRTVPPGCLLISAGIDVQKDRFAVLLLGWGRNNVVWLLDYQELPADPTRPGDWQALDEHLLTPFRNSRGASIKVTAAAVDCGYLTDDVLYFTRARRGRIIAVKGASQSNRSLIGKPSKVDYTWRGSVIKQGAEIYLIGGDTAKHWLFARLASDRKHPPQERQIRFPEGLDDSFYVMLTAESWDPNKRRWIKLRPRNEALDTFCYAVAAAMQPAVRVQTWREGHWAKLEAALEPAHGDLFMREAYTAAETKPAPLPPPPPKPIPSQPPPPPIPSNGGFINRPAGVPWIR